MNNCPNCGKVMGLHSSILQGCMCQYSMQAPPQRTWVGLTNEDIVDALQPLYQTRALAELAAELFMDEFQVVICKFMEKNT